MREELLLRRHKPNALAEVHEAGDYEKVADAQTAIAQIAIKERLRLQRARTEQDTSQEVEVEQPTTTAANHNSNSKEILTRVWLSKKYMVWLR